MIFIFASNATIMNQSKQRGTNMHQNELNKTTKLKFFRSLRFPSELNNKLEYIKKRTYLSYQQIVLMACTHTIESWCKALMDEELAIRTANIPAAPSQVSNTMPQQKPTIHNQLQQIKTKVNQINTNESLDLLRGGLSKLLDDIKNG